VGALRPNRFATAVCSNTLPSKRLQQVVIVDDVGEAIVDDDVSRRLRKTDFDLKLDTDRTPLPILDILVRERQKQFSQ
jgi:hypothetical protein